MAEPKITEIEVEGNAAGWLGFRPTPSETENSDIRFSEAMEPYDEEYQLTGLRPFETVDIVLEGGQFREDLRVVADEHGKIGVWFHEKYVAKDAIDTGASVKVGDDGGVIEFKAMRTTRYNK